MDKIKTILLFGAPGQRQGHAGQDAGDVARLSSSCVRRCVSLD